MKVKDLLEVLERANPEWQVDGIECINHELSDTETILFYNLKFASLSYPSSKKDSYTVDNNALPTGVHIRLELSKKKPLVIR